MGLLAASLVALFAGPALLRLFSPRPGLLAAVDGFVLVALAGLMLCLILPSSIAVAGVAALPAAALGLAAPTLIERYAFRSQSLATRHNRVMVLALSGLALHAFADGTALTSHAHPDHPDGDVVLALGVVLHRLPLGLVIWSRARARAGSAILALMAVATATGYSAGTAGLELVSIHTIAIFEAFIAGSLLHVAFASPTHAGDPLPGATARATGVGALLGLACVAGLVVLHPGAAEETGLREAAETFAFLALETAPALLIGFLGAGVLQALLRAQSARWLRGGGRFRQAVKGMSFGLPLPLCSCGVLPVYRSLVVAGAPTAAALAFLVATPEIGLDAFLLSVPLLGMELAILRLVCAAIVALAVGLTLARLADKVTLETADEDAEHPAPLVARLRAGLHFGFVELFDHTMPWIVLGLAVAAVIQPLLDVDWIASLPAGLDVVLLAVVGVPGYVCASGATPMVAILLEKGLSPGAAIAFLLTGPATNVTTMGVLARLQGWRLSVAFATAVPLFAIVLGIGVNQLGIEVGTLDIGTTEAHHASAIEIASLGVLATLLLSSLLRRGPRGMLSEVFSAIEDPDGCEDEDGHEHGHAH